MTKIEEKILTVVLAAGAGGCSAGAATYLSAILVELRHGPGTVSFEMGAILALFLAGIGGGIAGLCGAAIAHHARAVPGVFGWIGSCLAGAIVGAVGSYAFYSNVIASRATVPQRHVFWVGVVIVVGVAVGGACGAIVGRLLSNLDWLQKRLGTQRTEPQTTAVKSPPAAEASNQRVVAPRRVNALRVPALALISVGILRLVCDGCLLIGNIFTTAFAAPNAQPSVKIIALTLAFGSLQLAPSFLVVLGGVCMRKLRNYWLAVVGAVCAALPTFVPWHVLGIPFGIWSLILLIGKDTRPTFERR